MNQTDYSQLSDQELLDEAKEMKSFSIMNAFLIGFLMGIIFISIYFNAFGFFMLFPLYFVYKMFNDPRNKKTKALQKILKERNLKY